MENERRARRSEPVQGAAGPSVHQEDVRDLPERENRPGGEESADDCLDPDVRLYSLGVPFHSWPSVDDFEDERVRCNSTHPRQDKGAMESFAGLVERSMSGESRATARSRFFAIGLTHSRCDRERCPVLRTWYDSLRILLGRSSVSRPVPGHLGSSDANGEKVNSGDYTVSASGRNLFSEEV